MLYIDNPNIINPDNKFIVFDSIFFIILAPSAPKMIPLMATIIMLINLILTIKAYLINATIVVNDMQSRLVALALCVSILARYIKKKTKICPAPLANKPLIIPTYKTKYIYHIYIVCIMQKNIRDIIYVPYTFFGCII